MPDSTPPRPPPPWLDTATLALARAARQQPDAFSRSEPSRAVHDAILARQPALPFTLIGEAVDYVLATA